MSYIDDFIERLNFIPSQAQTILNAIKVKDREFQVLNVEVNQIRQDLLDRVQNMKEDQRNSKYIFNCHREMLAKESELKELGQEKIKLAEELYQKIHDLTEQLEEELGEQEEDTKKHKKKRKEWSQQNQPVYCYCRQQSFGKMIICDGQNCDIEWFHQECISLKKIPQHWYCKYCIPK